MKSDKGSIESENVLKNLIHEVHEMNCLVWLCKNYFDDFSMAHFSIAHFSIAHFSIAHFSLERTHEIYWNFFSSREYIIMATS